MTESYEFATEVKAFVFHTRTNATIEYVAKVYEGPRAGQYAIEHSHVMRPTQQAGFWYSDSYTSADSVDDAKALIRSYISLLGSSFEVKMWHVD